MDQKPIYLLVDKIQNDGMVGSTKEISKVFHNIELMGLEMDQDIAIRIPLVEEYLNAINRAGRFICVIRIKKDESSGRMDLFDFRAIPKNNVNNIANNMFGKYPGLAEQFLKHYRDLVSSFSPEIDMVEMSLSTLPEK